MLSYDNNTDHLLPDELDAINKETTHKWASQPKTLIYMTVMCAMCAVVQGMDETVINGAQLYFNKEFGIENRQWISGIVVSAPYLSSFVLGCALTEPLNNLLGRRMVIFLSCLIAGLASIWEAFTYSWVQMFWLVSSLVLVLDQSLQLFPFSQLNAPCSYPRRSSYDVANVDCIWYYAWFHCGCYFCPSRKH